MKFIAYLIIVSVFTTLINGSFTLYIRHNGGEPVAVDMDATSTVQHLREQIDAQLSAKQIRTSKVEIKCGIQNISELNNDTPLSDLEIGAESTINVNTGTELLTLHTFLNPGNYDSNDGTFSTRWNSKVGRGMELHYSCEVAIDTNTFFQDLESQIIEFIENEFNHTIPTDIGMTFIINPHRDLEIPELCTLSEIELRRREFAASSSAEKFKIQQVLQSGLRGRWPGSGHVINFVVATSDRHVKLERTVAAARDIADDPNYFKKCLIRNELKNRVPGGLNTITWLSIVDEISINDMAQKQRDIIFLGAFFKDVEDLKINYDNHSRLIVYVKIPSGYNIRFPHDNGKTLGSVISHRQINRNKRRTGTRCAVM